MYNEAIDEIHTHLIQRTPKKGVLYVAELNPEEGPNGDLYEGRTLRLHRHTNKAFFVCSSWRCEPKQDHLVCFLAGSLLLGAVSTRDGGAYEWASVPPTEEELNVGDKRAARDWKTGLELLNTCMETHKTETYARPSHFATPTRADGSCFVMTNRGLAPEIAHFRIPNEPQWISQVVSGEWYIKGSQCVTYLIQVIR